MGTYARSPPKATERLGAPLPVPLGAERDDTLPDCRLPYWADRLERGAVVAPRGIERGEPAPDTAPGGAAPYTEQRCRRLSATPSAQI